MSVSDSGGEPQAAVGDDKDWTWTSSRPCQDCGFDPGSVTDIGAELRATTPRWRAVLGRDDVRRRPAPAIWSPLEYACHVRDVHGVLGGRIAAMLREDGTAFVSWDQDEAAVTGRYWDEDPSAVAEQLAAATERAAATYDAVPAGAWSRTGVRGDGASFTVDSLGRYHLHDIVHHLCDVGG